MVAAAYDMIRLFIAPMSSTPRGIDRVDLSYLHYFAKEYPHDFGGVLPTAWGFRWFEREHILKWLDRLETLWKESIDASDDAVLQSLKLRLLSPRTAPPLAAPRPRSGRIRRVHDVVKTSGLAAGRSLVRSAPKGSIYINIGQVGLAMEWLLRWLDQRRDIKPAFMLHDVIPIATPELTSPRSSHYHCRMVDNAARFAAGMITTTRASRSTVMEEMERRGRSAIPVTTVHLPVAPPFLQACPADADLRRCNYFVVCGAIEPRKNHALLFDVWRRLVALHGSEAPRLVVAGFPAWRGEAILQQLESAPALRDFVVVVSGLSSPGLCSLIANARGLLMPSLAEGFGLPIIEALALGTPVIASNLPVHREVGKDFALYIDPLDRAAWQAAIERYGFSDEAQAVRRRIVDGYQPFTSDQYFREIAPFLESIAAGSADRPPPVCRSAARAGAGAWSFGSGHSRP